MDWDITDLVIRRSYDGGNSWFPENHGVEIIVPGEYGKHIVAGNLGIVQDENTGTIWLPFNRGNFEAWMSKSDDHGESFCEPYKMENIVKPSWTWIGFGPPAGLQLRDPASPAKGRLVVPSYYSDARFYDNGILMSKVFMMISDDAGKTWTTTDDVKNGNGVMPIFRGIIGNECQAVELPELNLANERRESMKHINYVQYSER